MTKQSPCHGCTERCVTVNDEGKVRTCHSTCKKHADYKEYIEQQKQIRHAAEDERDFMVTVRHNRYEKRWCSKVFTSKKK